MGRSEDEWREAVARLVKAKMKEAGVAYVEMVRRLKDHGLTSRKAR